MERSELELALDPGTQAHLLRQLVRAQDKRIQAAVAGNPNVPLDLLWTLSGEFPGEVLRNPCFELLSLEDPLWLEKPPARAVAELTNHPEAPEWFLEQMLSGPPEVIFMLAECSRRPEVLWRLARKYATSPDLLKYVVGNEHASPSLLEHLAVECDLMRPVLERQRHPAYFLEAFLEDRQARGEEPRKIRGKDVLLWHASAPLRQLEHLANSPRVFVRGLVARSPAASEELLVRLSRDPSVHVREQVARNERCPALLAQKLLRELPLRPESLNPGDESLSR